MLFARGRGRRSTVCMKFNYVQYIFVGDFYMVHETLYGVSLDLVRVVTEYLRYCTYYSFYDFSLHFSSYVRSNCSENNNNYLLNILVYDVKLQAGFYE